MGAQGAIALMIQFGSFVVSLVSLVLAVVLAVRNK
ncbi:MAG: putative holin-like toxin [Alicyclobacillus sp.]|nr:putative holin-like toxin [Alicyclobacillus sp.]